MKFETTLFMLCAMILFATDALMGQGLCYTVQYNNCSTTNNTSCSTCKTMFINPGSYIPVDEEHAEPGARKVLRCRTLIYQTFSGANAPVPVPTTSIGFTDFGPATSVLCSNSGACSCDENNDAPGDPCTPGTVTVPDYIVSSTVQGLVCWGE